MNIRNARKKDIPSIQAIEKEYYEGFTCPKNILDQWIEQLPEHFLIAEEDKKIVGFLFFEYFDKIKTVPFIHEIAHQKNGKYAYVSEVGILKNENALQSLVERMMGKAQNDGCKKILWLTGSKSRHDQCELKILQKFGFQKVKIINRWECYPQHFVSDHWLWEKII
jgi:N-acetylglutamate synthase-like GNAT family acetyltransferase